MVDGGETDFDNVFLEDVQDSLPQEYTREGLMKADVIWKGEIPQEWTKKKPYTTIDWLAEVAANKGKETVLKRTKPYPMKKIYWNRVYKDILYKSQFLLVFQNNFKVKDFTKWKIQATKGSPDLKICTHFKNTMYHRLLKTEVGGTYAGLQGLFTDKVGLVSGTNAEMVIEHMAQVVQANLKGMPPVLWLGGFVQGSIIDHVQMASLIKAGSESAIRGKIIANLMNPSRNLVRVLKNPTDNLVKVLAFQGTPPKEEAPTADAAPNADAAAAEPKEDAATPKAAAAAAPQGEK